MWPLICHDKVKECQNPIIATEFVCCNFNSIYIVRHFHPLHILSSPWLETGWWCGKYVDGGWVRKRVSSMTSVAKYFLLLCGRIVLCFYQEDLLLLCLHSHFELQLSHGGGNKELHLWYWEIQTSGSVILNLEKWNRWIYSCTFRVSLWVAL